MKNPLLAARAGYFNEKREGPKMLRGIELELLERGRSEGRARENKRLAQQLFRLGQLSQDEITRVCGITTEEMRKIKSQIDNR